MIEKFLITVEIQPHGHCGHCGQALPAILRPFNEQIEIETENNPVARRYAEARALEQAKTAHPRAEIRVLGSCKRA